MPYYPKSQIKTNLHTSGMGYLYLKSQKPYEGYYYEVSSGKKYVGKYPSNNQIEIVLDKALYYDIRESSHELSGNVNKEYNREESTNNILVTPYNNNNSDNYNPKVKSRERFIPSFYHPILTDEDIKNGHFKRYFSKKNTEYKYNEIDSHSYTKLLNKDPMIAWDLYSPACVKWQIKGNSEHVASSNLSQILLVETTQNWVGFSQYFKSNYNKFFITDQISKPNNNQTPLNNNINNTSRQTNY
jgi:hypothetical protein